MLRVQVKSRYATDCDKSIYIDEADFDSFDFLVVAFLNIGRFFGKHDGLAGSEEPTFYTFDRKAALRFHNSSAKRPKLELRNVLPAELDPFRNGVGFDLIAEQLGVSRPHKRK